MSLDFRAVRRLSLAAPAALLLGPAALGAQAPAHPTALAEGARLRVLPQTSTRRYVARLVRVSGDTAWLLPWATTGTEFALPLASVRRLEYSRGSRRHVGRNTLYGTAVGVVVGGVLGTVIGTEDDGSFLDISPGEGAVIVGAMFAMPGALIGALTGIPSTEDWAPVALPAPARSASGHGVRPRLGMARVPVRGGPAARVATLTLTVRPR